MNTELESTSKEVVMAEFEAPLHHFPRETGIPEIIRRIVSVLTEIWTGRLPNASQERYRLSQLAKYVVFIRE
jgi:hypothetical protein